MYKYVIVGILSLVCCSAQFTDELQNFEPQECIGEDKFRCISGTCIEQMQYCDGRVDCDDGTDENFCQDHQPDVNLCNQTHQFLCLDHNHCIPHRMICDGEPDCKDGSDETNCTGEFVIIDSAICNGYQCNDGTCISKLWVCDGRYDCPDRSDEYREDMCRHSVLNRTISDATYCDIASHIDVYKCLDSSYCLPAQLMCDGMKDCRDGSDEGEFCKTWHTMCLTQNCSGNETSCRPERTGPVCTCKNRGYSNYNTKTNTCEDINECEMERPYCSHHCINGDTYYTCKCDEGYVKDKFEYLCFAKGPEAMLFFSTRNEIKFFKIKSKQLVTVATGIKEAHGVSYDGQYLYWVQMAQGHQSIVRAHLENIEETQQTLASFGLEDPGDISVDWLGRNIFFSDAARGSITACSLDGVHCVTLPADTNHPKFVTVDPRNGKIYWADFHKHPVIMSARMNGSNCEVMAEQLETFVTGLSLDAPNGRLYFVDRTIKVLMISTKKVYVRRYFTSEQLLSLYQAQVRTCIEYCSHLWDGSAKYHLEALESIEKRAKRLICDDSIVQALFDEPFHKPYSIAVFENTVFWSDWASMTIQTVDKLHGTNQDRNLLLSTDSPVFGMHMYHPALMPTSTNPCLHHHCSHLCFVVSNSTFACGCPDGMELANNNTCTRREGYRPKYIVIAEGQLFTRMEYNTIGNPEGHATIFDIGRVQVMAYDNMRDTLYLYDGQRRSINYINMTDFTLGITHTLIYQGLSNVVDMDYDYVSDTLYVLDAGRRLMDAVSLRTQKRAVIYKFDEFEIPISFCVLPNYATMLVAIMGNEKHNIKIESIGLDGTNRHPIIMNDFKGPHVRLRYAPFLDNVFVSDEGNGVIDFMHPGGTGRENFRELPSTVSSLALTNSYVFWTDRRTPRLFWSNIYETSRRVRRIELSIFPNNTHLVIQATSAAPNPADTILKHPCRMSNRCSDVCVQSLITPGHLSRYMCFCPTGYYLEGDKCVKLLICADLEYYCYKSNVCIEKKKVCDGKSDCKHNEDETGCKGQTMAPHNTSLCDETEFQCNGSSICLPRLLVCDSRPDCPDGSDELPDQCDAMQCFDTEFKCASRRSCIPKTWRCDGDDDCGDGTDELDCEGTMCKPGQYQCRNRECIDVKKRCDGLQDCFDYSDEEDCEEQSLVSVPEADLPNCADYEFACELNKSICLPLTAKCNMKVDCPGATDENNCEFYCSPHKMFACKQQKVCIPLKKVCNGHNDCSDGFDETPDACYAVNKTNQYPLVLYPKDECRDGYLCDNGQCIEKHQICDTKQDCADNTDEGGQCSVECLPKACSHSCSRTPRGPVCGCLPGHTLAADGRRCDDFDECIDEPCSQQCINTPGSFLCSCHHGYSIRADRRSCKATHGSFSILYVTDNTIHAMTPDGRDKVEFKDPTVTSVNDIDCDVRKKRLYVTSAKLGKLIEVNDMKNVTEITNIGQPARVAVEWITGNVYFVDMTPGDSCIRVCNVKRNRCAKLQNLPSDTVVSALEVDPRSRQIFYCMTKDSRSVVWASSLSGHDVQNLTMIGNCTGLAIDSFTKQLYAAETNPTHIIKMDFKGNHQKVLEDRIQIQAPHGLAIFEDYIYYLIADTFLLSRCRLYGSKRCEPFIYQIFTVNTFVIRHESVQRDDLRNLCERASCDNVCVLSDDGPKCVCNDGSLSKDGTCPLVFKEMLPLFNGSTHQDYRRPHQFSYGILIIVLVLLVIYLGLFVYYHFVYKPRKNRSSNYAEVRYQTSAAGNSLSYAPSIDMASDGGVSHEFVNPLQYVRNIWRSSGNAQKPIGTANLKIDVPQSPALDLSDTESDLDDRENLVSIKKK